MERIGKQSSIVFGKKAGQGEGATLLVYGHLVHQGGAGEGGNAASQGEIP